MTPPLATARTTARDVQLRGVPVPTQRSGWEVSTARASADGTAGAGRGGAVNGDGREEEQATHAYDATVRALRARSRPQLTIRSGWIRISGVGSAIASPRPRTSIPRGCHGSVLARSSITIAARPVLATSWNFLVRSSS